MPTPRRKKRFKKLPKDVDIEALQQVEAYYSPTTRHYANRHVWADDTRLPGHAFKFDWQALQSLEDECYLVALSSKQIAWLEHLVNYFGRADYYRNEDYIARLWDEEKATENPAWGAIKAFMLDTAACLLMGCKVSDLNARLIDINVTLKYILATKSDGVVRDHLVDPGNLQRTADYFGVPVEDVPKGDGSGAVWHDINWPNLLETMDQFQAARRNFIEEVPSTEIKRGNVGAKSIAEMAYENWYYTPTATGVDGVDLDGEVKIGNADMTADHLYRIDLWGRHLVATQTRSGEIKVNLPDEPHIIGPFSGMRIGLYDAFNFENSSTLAYLGNISALSTIQQLVQHSAFGTLVSSLSKYLPRVYADPSVFTNGDRHPDDPALLSGRAAAPNYFDWLGKSTSEGLRSGSYPDIAVVNFPTVTIPKIDPIEGVLPTGMPQVKINLLSNYTTSNQISIPGSYGKGLASLFKLSEADRVIENPFGWGGGKIEFEDGRIYVTLPSRIASLPVLSWFLSGRIQIYPPVRTGFTFFETYAGESFAQIVDRAFRLRTSSDKDSPEEQQRKDNLWAMINPSLKTTSPKVVNSIEMLMNSLNLRPNHPDKQNDDTLTHAEILNAKEFKSGDVTVEPPTVNVTNTVPVPTVNVTNDFSEIVGKLGSIVNAIDSLAGKLGESWNSDNIQQLMDTLADLSIQAVAVSGEGNVVLSEGCCPDNITNPKPAEPKPKHDEDCCCGCRSEQPEKPTAKDIKEQIGDCEPVVTDNLLVVLDALIGAIDWTEDTFGEDLAQYLAPIVLVTAAASSTTVAGALAGLNLVTIPDPTDVATIAATTLGISITYILIQIFIDIGMEGLKLILGYFKYDRDFWKAMECQETSFEIDLIPDKAKKYVLEKVGDPQKALKIHDFFKKLLDSDLRKTLQKGKELIS